MIKKKKIPNKPVSDFDISLSALGDFVCFGFRYSDFEFCFGGALARKNTGLS